ncbi:MAG: AsmA family protein [Gammaproteobacteria bacterium]|nr:MAG: AsmA family protein [Gammaproteobacteria bacterium]
MAKLIKILVGLIVVVVVLIGAAVLILPQVIDPNDYKDQIVQVVKEKTGRDLRIDKPLKLSVFPWLGVEAGGVVLGNAPGFGKEPFAQIDELGVRVKLLPLLKRQIEVDTLVLEGAQLNLARNKRGKTNWEDLAAKSEEEPAEAKRTEQKAEGPAISSLKVQGIQLRNTRISWSDAQAGARYVLDKVRLETGSLTLGATVPVSAGFTLTSDTPKLVVVVDLTTQASASEDLQQFNLSDLELTIDGKGEGLPKGGMKVVVAANIEGDLAADTLKVEGLKVSGPQVEIKGQVSVAGLQHQPRLKGHLELAQTNVKQLAALFGTSIQTTDPKALTQVGASIDLAQEGKATRLEPFTITLDDTHAKGYVRLLDTKGPVVRARLDVDAIDLDRYLPPADEQEKGAPEKGEAQKGAAANDPFAALRPLDLQADLNIGKLVVSKARLQDVNVRVVSKGGVMKVSPIKASLYQGKFDGQVTLDARKKTPRIHAVKHLAGIQIGPLLKDVAGKDWLVGTGNLDLDLRIAGLTEAQIRKSLSGSGKFLFTDGAYKGVDIVKMIRNATGQGSNVSQSGNTEDKTEFTEMKGSFTARNGVIGNKDLSAKSPLLRLGGKGTVDLPANRIDYTLIAKLVASLQGQGGKAADQLKGVPIPVKIKGPLDNPGYALDIEAILTEKAKQQVRQKVEKEVQKKLGDKLKGPLGEGLKGLFGR